MATSLEKWERRARYAMGALALVAALGLAAFKLGWIATAPSYAAQSWYLVRGNERFIVTSEYADEAACRRQENPAAVCRQGKALIDEALHNTVPRL